MIQALTKLGLDLKEGKRHTKAECIHNGNKVPVPRHSVIKREVVNSICKFLLSKDFSDEKILELLR